MHQTSRIPLEDFFRNPEKSNFQISPAGNYVSFLAPFQGRMNIFVRDMEGGEASRITSVTDRDLAGYGWVNNERLLYLRDDGGDENFYLLGINVDGSNPKELTRIKDVRTQIVDMLEEDEAHIIIGLNQRNPQIFDPYRLNVDTGTMEQLAENPGNITSWMTDHEGKLRLAIATDGVNNTLIYRPTENDPFKPVITTDFKETVNPLFFTFDNQNIYAASNLNRDKMALVIFDLEKGQEQELIFSHPEVDVHSLRYSRKRKVITTANYQTWRSERHYFDGEIEQLLKILNEKLGEEVRIAINSMNRAEDKMIVRTYSDLTQGAYHYYDQKNDELIKLEELSPWLDASHMASMKPVSYQSRDGLRIHGYLTLPKNLEPKNLPVVVNPHGGPWWRDSWGFKAEVQFLANRGYAVFQMNFRGSTGYGRVFWEASFKQWGLKMQDDITDGVNWLIDQGLADPSRIAIYGGSYGGYATLSGLTKTPDLYTCAIDYVGVSNLFTFIKTIPPYWKPYLEMLYEMVGNPDDENDRKNMEANSPVFHAAKIKKPLFIAQGAKDPRVNKDESDQMVAALKKRGVEVAYLVKENEGHGFQNEENRFEFYQEMEKFLEEHLGQF